MLLKNFKEVPIGLGKSLKDIREILGLSQIQLARHANVSRSVIADLEQEKHMPYIVNLIKICEALKITPAELFAYSLPDWEIEKNTRERTELHKLLRRSMSNSLTK